MPPVQFKVAPEPCKASVARSGKEITAKVSLNVVFPPNAGAQLVVVAVTTTILVLLAWSGMSSALHSFVPTPLPLTVLARFSQVTGGTYGPGDSADPARLRFVALAI